jgi:hypothetical protein
LYDLNLSPYQALINSAPLTALLSKAPAVSKVAPRGIAPAREIAPKVGRRPNNPFAPAGPVIDPLVSDPIALSSHSYVAKPAAEPDEDVEGLW